MGTPLHKDVLGFNAVGDGSTGHIVWCIGEAREKTWMVLDRAVLCATKSMVLGKSPH